MLIPQQAPTQLYMGTHCQGKCFACLLRGWLGVEECHPSPLCQDISAGAGLFGLAGLIFSQNNPMTWLATCKSYCFLERGSNQRQ